MSLPQTRPTPLSSINRSNNSASSSIFSTNSHTYSSIANMSNQAHPAVSSIFRVGDAQKAASTSIYHPGKSLSQANSEEERDSARYEHMRRLMRKKRAEEAEEEAEFMVKTGGAFRKKKFHKSLVAMKLMSPGKYKNLSYDDIAYFEKLIGDATQYTRVGTGFSRTTKRHLKHQLWNDYRSGKVASKEDWKDMEHLVDNLPAADY